MIVDGLTFSYTENTPIFDNVSMHFDKNKIYSIVGPSGCGKTTLFKLLVGIEQLQKGRIVFDDGDHLSIMMQTDTLLPWRTVKDNIQLGSELTSGKGVQESIIDDYLLQFKLDGIKQLFPTELSTGMKQRVSLIQSMVGETEYLFLDEPFSNLDFDVKLQVQRTLLEYHQRIKNTIVIITHDIEDAIVLSDEIIVLSAKPVKVMDTIHVEIDNSDPVIVRSEPIIADYFQRIWSLLKPSL